ncbi:hypothetical protein Rxycam_01492 [Rubrobacter xylanophilus DSM 9941]|uniref:hypothetical protein n=1 Tax=Rubrobacter xylanophilus TaxID=49319 RepID=UPI001C644004|nr:hypothetical protein [Rubrobacter xylanophilus]QYJ15666.1 hypothetical protein Rxycam_01492 [Rubrobacter xylanophilus DSM 9941]
MIRAFAVLAALPLLAAGVLGGFLSVPLACAATGGLMLLRLREQWKPAGAVGGVRMSAPLRRGLPRLLPLLEPAVFLLAAAALLDRTPPAAGDLVRTGVLLAGLGAALAASRTLPVPSRLVAAALALPVFAGALAGGLPSALLILASGCALLCVQARRAAFLPLVGCFAAVASLVLSGGPEHVAHAWLLSVLGILLARRWSFGSWRFAAALVMAASVCAAGVLSLVVPAGAASWSPGTTGGLLPELSGEAFSWVLLTVSAAAGLLVRARCGTLRGRMQTELFLFLVAASAVGLLAGGSPGAPGDVAAAVAAGYGVRWWIEALG